MYSPFSYLQPQLESYKKKRHYSGHVHPFCQYDFVLMEGQKAIELIEVAQLNRATGVTKTMIVMNETSHFLALYNIHGCIVRVKV